jgi:hypothetical protein
LRLVLVVRAMAVVVAEEWPDLEALQKYTQALRELNWSRYSECMTVLGTKR